MRFLLDENVPAQLGTFLSGAGHDVPRVPSGIQNGQVLKLSHEQSRILITLDPDFANRLLYPPSQHSGIVILLIHPPQTDKLAAVLQRFLREIGEKDLAGKVVLLEETEYHLLT